MIIVLSMFLLVAILLMIAVRYAFPPQQEDPDGMHRHKCRNCNYAWEHKNSCAGDKKAHTCAQCGKEVWFKHFDIEDIE